MSMQLKRNKLAYYALIGLLLMSCTASTTSWSVVQGGGLAESHADFDVLLLPDSTKCLLLGSKWPEELLTAQNVETNQQALIQRSVDNGKSWHAQQFGRGRFAWAKQVSSRIYAIKLVTAPSGQNSSTIYRSEDAGASWQEIGQLAEGVKSLLMVNDTGYAVGYRENASGSAVLFKTENGGKTWREFPHSLPRFVDAATTADGLVFFLASAERPTHADRIALVNAASFATKIEKLGDFQADVFFAGPARNLWFLTSRKPGGVRLVEREGATGTYHTVGVFKQYEKLAAEAVYISGTNAYLMLSLPKAYLNAYKFFHGTLHAGHWSWVEEPLPIDYTLKPYGFYPNGQCYIYALDGRLLVRK